jgi:hypothetical protein
LPNPVAGAGLRFMMLLLPLTQRLPGPATQLIRVLNTIAVSDTLKQVKLRSDHSPGPIVLCC